MKTLHTTKIIAACALLAITNASFSHVSLREPTAVAGTSYRATLRVSHGCHGSPVTALRVTIPDGFMGANPMPMAGWVLSMKSAELTKPYDSHGKNFTDEVAEITWTAVSKEDWLPDAYYEDFVLRGSLPGAAGSMWFKVLQTCEKGSIDWAEVPASGTSTKGLKAPAALLDIIESGPVGHAH